MDKRADEECPDGTADSPLMRPVAHGWHNNSVKVDLTAIADGCTRAINDRSFVGYDGSPPMVALSADVVLAVVWFAQSLSALTLQEQSPEEMRRVRAFAARGPSVGGSGAADAEGSTVHHIHVSAVYRKSPKESLMTDDEWQRQRERAILGAFQTGRPVFADSEGVVRYTDGAGEPVADDVGRAKLPIPAMTVQRHWWTRLWCRLRGLP